VCERVTTYGIFLGKNRLHEQHVVYEINKKCINRIHVHAWNRALFSLDATAAKKCTSHGIP
jgi:acid stress-induced BolA-like protein IbaG/YrbA